MKNILLIAVCGAFGVLIRYALDQLLAKHSSPFPLSTFLINVVGSFLLGIFYSLYVADAKETGALIAPIIVGLLGGFTTFSSYALQTFVLLREKQTKEAIVYFLFSPITGLIGVWLGASLGRFVK